MTNLGSESGVGILDSSWDLVLGGQADDLLHQADDGVVLLVGFAQSGLELAVGVQKTLDLVHGVHDEHVDQILPGPVQPVVERLKCNTHKINHQSVKYFC